MHVRRERAEAARRAHIRARVDANFLRAVVAAEAGVAEAAALEAVPSAAAIVERVHAGQESRVLAHRDVIRASLGLCRAQRQCCFSAMMFLSCEHRQLGLMSSHSAGAISAMLNSPVDFRGRLMQQIHDTQDRMYPRLLAMVDLMTGRNSHQTSRPSHAVQMEHEHSVLDEFPECLDMAPRLALLECSYGMIETSRSHDKKAGAETRASLGLCRAPRQCEHRQPPTKHASLHGPPAHSLSDATLSRVYMRVGHVNEQDLDGVAQRLH